MQYEESFPASDTRPISFGPVRTIGDGGCVWGRAYSLSFKAPVSAKKILADFEASNVKELNSIPPILKQLGNVQVVSRMTEEYCTFPSVTVIGEVHNYEISALCGYEKDLLLLEHVASSIEFL